MPAETSAISTEAGSSMSSSGITRRVLLKTLAGGSVLVARPAAAGYWPTMDEVANDPDQPVLGNPEGEVTIVEYFDYMCPACRVAYTDLKELVAEDGNIRVVMKDWPIFGDDSRDAARLVLATHPQGKYAEAVEALMTSRTRLTRSRTEEILEAAGIDILDLRITLLINEELIEAMLARNAAQASAFKLPGTPGFVIGTTIYRRYLDRQALREATTKARSRLYAQRDPA